jgi:hypothetical protein
VETRRKKAPDLSKACVCVWKFELWRQADGEPTRENALRRIVKMLNARFTNRNSKGER